MHFPKLSLTSFGFRLAVPLAAALQPLGEVIIDAPSTQASADGHSLTLRRPLRLELVRSNVYSVDGTPTDCVNIAITPTSRPSTGSGSASSRR